MTIDSNFKPDFDLIINAGGQSRRMGRSKALLTLPTSGKPLLRHIRERLAPLGFCKTWVLSNDPNVHAWPDWNADTHCLYDRRPASGPLAGLETALTACRGWAFVTAVDLPLIQVDVVRYLLHLASENQAHSGKDSDSARIGPFDAIIPFVNGQAQTLHAIFHRRCLSAISASLDVDQRRMTSFLDQIKVRWVYEPELRPLDAQLRSFFNVNTPQEWNWAIKVIEERD